MSAPAACTKYSLAAIRTQVALAPRRARESRRLLGLGLALVVGWTDPEGRRPLLDALLLAYYDPDGRLIYAGRAGSGINDAELARLWHRLQPLAVSTMPVPTDYAIRT